MTHTHRSSVVDAVWRRADGVFRYHVARRRVDPPHAPVIAVDDPDGTEPADVSRWGRLRPRPCPSGAKVSGLIRVTSPSVVFATHRRPSASTTPSGSAPTFGDVDDTAVLVHPCQAVGHKGNIGEERQRWLRARWLRARRLLGCRRSRPAHPGPTHNDDRPHRDDAQQEDRHDAAPAELRHPVRAARRSFTGGSAGRFIAGRRVRDVQRRDRQRGVSPP